MPNKHFCQGTNCHTNPTTDRFLKSKGIIRGRYAMSTIDSPNHWATRAKYFCSTRCESDWLNDNMHNIERGIPISFITHRRISEGYHKTKGRWGQNYIEKIGVDNDNDNDRIIP
jgi:hypothetical protein|tara:strand:+ start:81 stop:422 length:342 start_codon:yes stop_codon:yes gene_type:complete